jgi:two-component system CitB family response regulator
VDQAEIDELVALLRGGASAVDLPKGLSPATLALVARTVRAAAADVSATDVADGTGMSRVTSRRYLDHLARTGLVAVTMRYGTAGRPEHRYRWVAPKMSA